MDLGTRDAASPAAARDTASPAAVRALPDGGSGDLIPETFEALYPIFLLRKLDPVQKALLWNRYRGRWVRWTGKLVAFTRDGAAFRMLPGTTTFDVSLAVDARARAAVHRRPIGAEVTFVGRLDHYDDVFRTFYLTHGDLAPPR